MANNYLITGYWGEPHVTAENDRGIHAGIFGVGRYVLPIGRQFSAEYIGNNVIRMYDGKLMDNGAAAGIPAGEYVDLMISNAGQGMNRNDLIVFQYSIDASTLVEKGEFIVIKGTETNGTASDPAVTQADLLSGNATLEQFPLWRVSVSGVAISAPVKMFVVSKTIPDKADSGHSHALTSGNITGVLPVTKGGTGANSVSKARKALGLGETEGALPIENGGTGATTAATARSNLGITPANIGAATKNIVSGSYTCATDADIDNALMSYISDTSDYVTGERFITIFNSGASSTGLKIGATWFVQISKSSANYGVIFAKAYDGSGNVYCKMRSWTSGKLNAWFDVYTSYSTIPIANGGTGATDAAKARENLGITPANIGALPITGGTMTGGIDLGNATNTNGQMLRQHRLVNDVLYRIIHEITTTGNCIISRYNGSTQENYVMLASDSTRFGKPVIVASGGTGATNAADALKNLGVIYSADEPTYQAGAIWLKPVE